MHIVHFGVWIFVLQVREEHVRRMLPLPAGRARSPEHNDDIAQLHAAVHLAHRALQHTHLLLLQNDRVTVLALLFPNILTDMIMADHHTAVPHKQACRKP